MRYTQHEGTHIVRLTESLDVTAFGKQTNFESAIF